MEPVMRNAVFALFVLLLSAPALADEQPIDLKKAPGLDVVEGNCAACHSLDYVQMNSPFLNAAGWDAEVSKMIKLFGAPISDEDAKKIADYLKANYGVN
jgi:sulfite dehydrogenase (cytochrome) subunit B